MRHHDKNRKFGRERGQRRALLRLLAESLLLRGSIETTLAKAKELRPYVEKLVTKGKKDSLAARRLVTSRLRSKIAVRKIFGELGKKYLERPGGYIRITKLGRRGSDARELAKIEFI